MTACNCPIDINNRPAMHMPFCDLRIAWQESQRTRSHIAETSQYDSYRADIRAVLEGTRPLAIIEREKSAPAYRIALDACCLTYRHKLVSFHGWRGDAVALARDLSVLSAYKTLLAVAPTMTRANFQRAMGALLGYDAADIETFIDSDVAKRCKCEPCGSRAHKNQTELDAHVARTMPR